jgi:hypothetical protein
VSARLPTADDNRLRPGLRVVYVKGEQKYPRELTPEERRKVEEATRYEMTNFYGEARRVLKFKGKRRPM